MILTIAHQRNTPRLMRLGLGKCDRFFLFVPPNSLVMQSSRVCTLIVLDIMEVPKHKDMNPELLLTYLYT
jgi:hypothetical protein